MKDKDLMKMLIKDGWELVSIKGSHHKLKKGNLIERLSPFTEKMFPQAC